MANKSVKKNYIYNLAYQILLVIVPFVTIPYLSRILGVENIGINSFTLSIVSYFIMLANIGVGSLGQREIALRQDDRKAYSKIFWNLFSFQAVVGLISILTYIIYVVLFGSYPGVQWIMIINIIAAVVDMAWFYRGLEEYRYISIRNIFIKLASVAAIFAFVHAKDDLPIYVLINSLSLLISSALLWIKFPKIADKPVLKEIRIFKYWKDSIIYFLPQVATSIYTVLDKTMLGFITGSEAENGFYEQTYKIIQLCLILITSLNAVIAPRMAFLYGKGKKKEMQDRMKTSFHFIYLVAFPIIFGLIAIGPAFSVVFFGEGYEKVQTLLPLFAPIVLIISVSNCIGGQFLVPIGKRIQTAAYLWLGAGVNVICNFIFIPLYASHGAAIGSIIAELVITICYIRMLKKYMSLKIVFKPMVNYLLSSIFMFIVLMLVNHFWPDGSLFAVIIKIACGVVVYFVALVPILRDGFFTSEAKKTLSKIVHR